MKFWTFALIGLFACSTPPAEAPASNEAPDASELTSENFLEPAHLPEALQAMERVFATRVVPRSGPVYELTAANEPFDLTYEHEGTRRGLEDRAAGSSDRGPKCRS